MMFSSLLLAACNIGGSGKTVSDATNNPGGSAAPTGANSAPLLRGTPATFAVVGITYIFRPASSDANGDALTYSIENKPAWASFNVADGTLSGTPTSQNLGTTSAIRISATDGTATATLAAFSLQVVTKVPTTPVSGSGTGTATIRWTAPTQTLGGDVLSNLSGYRVYYGISLDALQVRADIPSPTTTTYSFSSLARGTHYFAISALTMDGKESDISAVSSKTIL
jgi:hypothetical protein